ncbi:MAG: hypothetical protein WCA10_12040 [Terracidiphilus sp.]
MDTGAGAPAGAYTRIDWDLDTVPMVAVSVVFCVLLTADAATLKLADVLPAATFTEGGGFSVLLLLESMTSVWAAAAALKFTEHVIVAGPVTDCVAHERLLSATGAGSGPATGSSVMTSVSVTPPAFAVIVTLTDLLTASLTALNSAVFAPAATTTDAGTTSAGLLLDKDTEVALVAASLRYTEQTFVCAPVND